MRVLAKLEKVWKPCWSGLIALGLVLCLTSRAAAESSPGTALRFNGTTTWATAGTTPEFNAFPLTVTAWIRTTNSDPNVHGIASKYVDASINGFSLFMVQGRIRAFYFSSFFNYIWDGGLGLDGGFVADGAWHHIAFVVDPNGGRLLVDGQVRASRAWTGFPGPSSSGTPFQIGRYDNYPTTFQGDLDEVAVWSESLGTSTLNYLKHRKLVGNEPGLLALWSMDDGAGAASVNSVPTGPGLDLVGDPAWLISSAPIGLSMVAGRAIKLDGTRPIELSSSSAQNALPITVMAWIKTTQRTGAWPGIVTKYLGNSANGWALALNAGRLAPWYYADLLNKVEPTFASANDRFVADGQWHHVAFSVDTTVARTYIDGVLVATTPWTGSSRATTSTEPVRLGTYPVTGLPYEGLLDQVSIWNRVLNNAEIETYSHARLTGAESGLVAGYDCDDEGLATLTDVRGELSVDVPEPWLSVGSAARLGDGSVVVRAASLGDDFSKDWAIRGAKDGLGFLLPVKVQAWAFHDYATAPGFARVDVEAGVALTRTVSGSGIILDNSTATLTRSLVVANANDPMPASGRMDASMVINAVPAATEQIDSVNETVAGLESLSLSVNQGPAVLVESQSINARRLLHFNGALQFGDVDTRFASVSAPPVAGALNAPDSIGVTLALPLDGGFVASQPLVTFGGGVPFLVDLLADGTARVASGSFNATLANAGLEVNGIRYTGRINLSPSGAIATTLAAYLPNGIGLSGNTNDHLQFPILPKRNVQLTPNLIPVEDPVVVTPADVGFSQLCFNEETKPIWFVTSRIEWRVSEGLFVIPTVDQTVYVREEADARLASLASRLEDPNQARRISNDGYYRGATAAPGTQVVFKPDTDGNGRVDADLDVAELELRPHFPYLSNRVDTFIGISSGRLTIRDDQMVRGVSYVSVSGGTFPLQYARECTDANCGAGGIDPATLDFSPESALLYLTADGGMTAVGTVPPQNLTWGHIAGDDFAHRTSDVSQGAYAMAGTFLRGDSTTQPDGLRPTVLLLSGFVQPGDDEYVERPGTLAYRDGLANYPGINFRSPATAASILGGQTTGDYPLRSRSKYYARASGVAGIHEAASFPSRLKLAGYDFRLTGLLLSFLESRVEESRTDGDITLPAPAGFIQEFAELRFHCRGTLESAKIPGTSGDKTLVYWPAVITPRSLFFTANPSVLCANPGESFLVLGSDIKVDSLPEKLFGRLGFEKDGHLVTGTNMNAQGTGVDSRFAPPARVSMAGPGTSTYLFSTVSEAYFNNARVFAPATWLARNGFVNLVGKVDLPLFEDMPAHLHLRSGGKRAIDIAGGWKAGGKDFFNDPKFDAAQIGFNGASLNDYRTAVGSRPVARKNWLGFIDFDYPLAYTAADGVFTSASKTQDKLLILDVENRVKRMTPTQAELKFGVEAGLPNISVGNLGYSAVEGITGAGDALNKALGSAAGGVLKQGLDSLNGLLADQLNAVLDNALRDALKPQMLSLLNTVSNAYVTAPTYASFANSVTNLPRTLLSAQLGRALEPAQAVFQDVQKALDETIGGLDVTLDLLNPATRADRIRNLAVELLKKETSIPPVVAEIAVRREVLDPLFKEVDPTLNEIRNQLLEVRRRVSDLRSQIGVGFGEVVGVMGSEPPKLLQKMGADLLSYLPAANFDDRRFFAEHTADQVLADLRRKLSDAVFASEIPRALQTAIKQRLYDVQAELQTALGGVFQMVNGVLREAIVKAGQPLDDAVKGFLGDSLSGVGGAAKIVGVAEINMDSIKRVRLDASLHLKLPDDFGFNGYLEIRELSSENTPVACLDGYDKATEVSLGATDVTLGWISKDLRADLGGKFIFQAAGGGFTPVGMSGYTAIRGKVEMGGLVVRELGAALAFGREENYFAGRVRAEFNSKEVAAGFFFGRTCFPDPLIVADPDVAKTLPMDRLPLTGAYMYGEGWFPLNEVFGIPSSCVFNIRAGAGQGAFFFMDGSGLPVVGAKYSYGLSGQVLCVLGVQGEIRIVGSIPGLKKEDLLRVATLDLGSLPRLTLRGVGKVSAEIGYCPFCLSFSKEIGITIRNASPLLILTSVGGPAVMPAVVVDTLLNIGELEFEVDF